MNYFTNWKLVEFDQQFAQTNFDLVPRRRIPSKLELASNGNMCPIWPTCMEKLAVKLTPIGVMFLQTRHPDCRLQNKIRQLQQ